MDAARHHALIAIARRWVQAGWSAGTGAGGRIVDELHAPGFIDHDSGGRPPDNEGFREGIVRLLAAFPDLQATLRDTVVEVEAPAAAGAGPGGAGAGEGPAAVSGTVTARWTAIGTHRGPYLGAEPTGRRIVFKGIEIIHIRDGRITERWGEWDGLELLAQLGRLP